MSQKEFISMILIYLGCLSLAISAVLSWKSVSVNEQRLQESCSMFFQGTNPQTAPAQHAQLLHLPLFSKY